jgi:hypothetical protein
MPLLIPLIWSVEFPTPTARHGRRLLANERASEGVCFRALSRPLSLRLPLWAAKRLSAAAVMEGAEAGHR